jgi:hypothetical protein
VLVLAPGARAKQFAGLVADVPAAADVRPATAPVAHAARLFYEGGPVLHANRTHLIFWAPSNWGLTFEPGYIALIKRFLADVAADSRRPTNVYSLSGQYRDSGGAAAYASSHAPALLDTYRATNRCVEPPSAPLWTHCVSDAEIAGEIARVVNADHLPQTGRDIYFLLTPDGMGSCEFTGPSDCALGGSAPGSYCGYHTTGYGLLYAVIPYNAVPPHCQSTSPRPNSSSADPAISTVSHEHNEVVTDPLGDAWLDPSSQENGDLCLTNFGPALGGSGAGAYNEVIHRDHYYLQEEWSNRDGGCRARDEADHAAFMLPSHLRAGVRATFTGRASDADGSLSAYNWFFGDHTRERGRRVKHAFKRAGVYRVVLRTTDRDALWAFAAHTIKVSRR